MEDGRHFAVWVDPHPKPSYLFALVRRRTTTPSTTRSSPRAGATSRSASMSIPAMRERARYAMDALKRAMKWDEDAFQREYDLDVFNIVAVRDFNFGAMENKGLNIFNSSLILADAETATDADFEAIEAVVGHEYFHNWTGNRITCRDWFQLCLKEGLTVYREQEFSADQRSRPVQRIKDVKRLRARQFGEDAGPLAHPVRPSSYQKIDNFYTATVYEKGGEVIRMLKRLIGEDAFDARHAALFRAPRRHGLHGGGFHRLLRGSSRAATSPTSCAGTNRPARRRSKCDGDYDAARAHLSAHVSQRTAPTPGQPDKLPLPIPLHIGFIAADGAIIAPTPRARPVARTEHALVLDDAQHTFRFYGVLKQPIPALLRGFSAPVTLMTILGADAAPGADGARSRPVHALGGRPSPRARHAARRSRRSSPPRSAAALGRELDRAQEDPAFAALALRLPDLNELILAAATPDPGSALRRRAKALRRTIAASAARAA